METKIQDNKGNVFELFDYQVTGAELLLSHPRYILYWDCGVGKTLAMVAALNQLPRGKVLIASPKSVRINMWERLGIPINHDVTYLHYDMFPRTTKWPVYDYIIFDECHKIKGSNTQTAKIAAKLSRKAKFVWGASATIAANSYVDTFRILRTMGVPEFEYPESAFIARYYNTYSMPIMTRFGTKNIVKPIDVRKQFEGELKSAFAKYCDSIDMEDVHNLPERHDSVVYVDGMISEEYKLAEEGIIKFSDDDVDVVAKLQACAKARQAAGGFLYHTDLESGTLRAKRLFDVNPKMETLRRIVKEHSGEKLIIAYSFRYEKQKIVQMLEDMGLRVTDDLDMIDYCDVLVRQMNKGEGINLQHFAHTMIMYSFDYSYIAWTQMQGRIYRVGQKNETNFITIISRGTIEETVYKAVQTKQTLDEYLRSVTKH